MENVTIVNQSINYKQPKYSGITFVLNFCVIPGAGFIYLGDQFTNRGIVFIVVTIALAGFTVITGGVGFLLLIPWDIIIIVLGFSATNEYNRLIKSSNIKIHEQNQIIEQVKNNFKKENELLSKKVKCVEFVDKIEKYSKLLKNDLISEEEFNDKKQKLINDIVLYKVAENPEDFLTVIVDLKTKEILTQEDLQKIKKIIL